jgi:hypothetical protein
MPCRLFPLQLKRGLGSISFNAALVHHQSGVFICLVKNDTAFRFSMQLSANRNRAMQPRWID